MTIHVNIGEAKTRLSALLAAVRRGEEVVITRDGAPEARLVPADPDRRLREIAAKRRAGYGCLKGTLSQQAIDRLLAPLSEEELAQWYDTSIFPAADDDAVA